MRLRNHLGSICVFLIALQVPSIYAQSATISESIMPIDTYSFNEPNPVPTLADNPKIYPYFKFEGYQHKANKRNWKVVTLENEYIKVFVLPEVGGKVWGAIDKKTGKEFIYRNEVLKFRNIAMRGPWTSGGIEFNFGIIGHTPTTATPVDYVIMKNIDGSVSCVIGATDLPSRTRWRVEIKLQKDKTFFETKASWYNPTPLNQSYYNWMTGAAVASDDLEFFIPGNQYLKHNGEAKVWPIDKKGREISFYRHNKFGPHKSYHVVGEYKDFFGGYYHKSRSGFGHWAPYEEMPGQKLWLWALSRAGGVWEDLLTDTDGQYVEFQAGRLFNQFAPGSDENPITQANFDPNAMDRWREIWFPYNEIGGMVDASEYGVLNVERKNGEIYIGVNALQGLKENLKVLSDDQIIFNKDIRLRPGEIYSKTILSKSAGTLEVILGDKKLYYSTDKKDSLLKRPFRSDEGVKRTKSEQLYRTGWESMKFREYDKAFKILSKLVSADPSHERALVKLAELEYRRTNYKKGLELTRRALTLDTYNSGANYMAGILYRELKDPINALEAMGWAARDIKYRSVSYAQMAEIFLSIGRFSEAKNYANKALDFNRFNLNARQVLLLLARQGKDSKSFKNQTNALIEIDPLNHFAAIESSFYNGVPNSKAKLSSLRNEFSAESILEIVIWYFRHGLTDEARHLVYHNPNDIKTQLWMSYLLKDSDSASSGRILDRLLRGSTNFVFPYRRETIPVLEWALKTSPSWKLKYYLAQNYLAVGQHNKGLQLLRDVGDSSTSDVFYRFRAKILPEAFYAQRQRDYRRALRLNSADWKVFNEAIQFNLKAGKYAVAESLGRDANRRFPLNYDIGVGYAKALLNVRKFSESIGILKTLDVLPSESARESHTIYEDAHVRLADKYIRDKKYLEASKLLNKSKEWPENLGVGRPYDVDTRLQDFLLAICFENLHQKVENERILNRIAKVEPEDKSVTSINSLFPLLAMKKLSKTNDLKKQISILERLSRNGDEIAGLVLSVYKNEPDILAKLENEGKLRPGLSEIIETSLNY